MVRYFQLLVDPFHYNVLWSQSDVGAVGAEGLDRVVRAVNDCVLRGRLNR